METPQESTLDIFDYYTIMDRTSVVLNNFGDIAVLAESCPELSAKADSLAEAIADFYQSAANRFNEELDDIDGSEYDEDDEDD
jgi:hypothetical protein